MEFLIYRMGHSWTICLRISYKTSHPFFPPEYLRITKIPSLDNDPLGKWCIFAFNEIDILHIPSSTKVGINISDTNLYFVVGYPPLVHFILLLSLLWSQHDWTNPSCSTFSRDCFTKSHEDRREGSFQEGLQQGSLQHRRRWDRYSP